MTDKSTCSLLNPTKYFCPTSSRTVVHFPSSVSYSAVRSKREGYEARLYWEYLYCRDLGGQTFFYTLTYNDDAIPKFYGKNCFDYKDLRYLLNGGFKKYLLRHFGTEFKYFVGAELGDGKGSRGIGNNPHYHILFFLRPSSDKKYHSLYKKIHPVVFRSLIRNYWQGSEFIDYRAAKFGIAREGRFLGVVQDFRACLYVAKYCVKDAGLKSFEDHLRLRFESKYRFRYADSLKCYQDFVNEVINPDWNIRQPDGSYFYDIYTLISRHVPDYVPIEPDVDLLVSDTGHSDFIVACQEFINSNCLQCKYAEFVSSKISEFVKRDINTYRNRYTNKCRISNGVGLYALDCLEDFENPKVKVPSKTGFKFRPLCLYYYRKLFCASFKDKKGSVLYTLNSVGIDYRVNHLPEYIDSYANCSQRYFSLLLSNPLAFSAFYRSEFNTCLFDNHSEFVRKFNLLVANGISLRDLCRSYSEYKIVYEDRFFKVDREGDSCSFPRLCLAEDYRRFLLPSALHVNRVDSAVSHFLEWHDEDWLPYSSHPSFYPYLEFYSLLDACSDYFFVQKDDEEERSYSNRESVRRFHSQRLFEESF